MSETGWSMRRATAADLGSYRSLLEVAGLPEARLEDQFREGFVLAIEEGRLVGGAGVEVYGTDGLLRSVVVVPDRRGTGLGAALVRDRLQWALRFRLVSIYLLTEDAAGFFSRFGFKACARSEVPAPIRASREFARDCPESATVMVLHLAGSEERHHADGGRR